MAEYIVDIEDMDDFENCAVVVDKIVRCRDCKHCVDEPWMGRSVFICNRTPWQRSEGERKAGEYCSRGERREDG